MHKNILNNHQKDLFPLLEKFSSNFYLAGGTAIALQIGHRKSIDFDLFSEKKIDSSKLKNNSSLEIQEVLVEEENELTVIINKTKITFLHYPFAVKAEVELENKIKMPSLISLAAMKAYTLGRRSELKDYIDLYFLLKEKFSLEEIEKKASGIFGNLFSAKLFRVQLVYFKDLDFDTEVEVLDDFSFMKMKKFFENIVSSGQ